MSANKTVSLVMIFGFLMFAGLSAGPKTAYAACSNPTGAAGDFVYNSSQKRFQYCNDSLWVSANLNAGSGTGGCSNPSGDAGSLVFNYDYQVVQGCAGNEWHALGPVGGLFPNQPVPINFDGASYLVKNSDLNGNADSKYFTMSFWFRKTRDGYVEEVYSFANTGGLNRVVFGTNNKLAISFTNSADSVILGNFRASTDFTGDRNWHHVLISVDMTNSAKCKIYIDGVDVTFGPLTRVDDFIDFTETAHAIASNGITNRFSGDLADVWIAPGTYIDFSVAANRQKFIKNGRPVELGADGSNPTGTTPKIFLSGDKAGWATNKGTGGGFTTTGTLGDGSAPVKLLSTNVGLVSHWKLDDGTGSSTVSDSVSDNDGTLGAGLNASSSWVNGKFGKAIDFPGTTNAYVSMGDPADGSLDFGTTQSFTVSAWMKPDTLSGTRRIVSKGHWGWNNGGYALFVDGSGRIMTGTAGTNQGNSTMGLTSASVITAGAWHLVTAVFNQSAKIITIYVNGTAQSMTKVGGTCGTASGTTLDYSSCSSATASSSLAFHIGSDHTPGEYFDGLIDDVRIYDRALSAAEVTALYTGSCTSPSGKPGKMVYNGDSRRMQYCTEDGWASMPALPPCHPHCGGRSDEKVVFTRYAFNSGSFGGITGGDNLCQASANAAGLSGTYKAWLADSNPASAPATRFIKASVPYIRVDGVKVADDWADLTDGTLDNNMDLSELNIVTSAPGAGVRTNVNTDGTQSGADTDSHCNNWSSIGNSSKFGSRYTVNTTWTDWNFSPLGCSASATIYCFEQ